MKEKEKYVKLPEHILLGQVANTPEQLREYFRQEGRDDVIRKIKSEELKEKIKLEVMREMNFKDWEQCLKENPFNEEWGKPRYRLDIEKAVELTFNKLEKEWESFKRKNG